MMKEYVFRNWALILVLAAFAISLRETVFLDRITIRRMYVLIVEVFLLSIVVFAEFCLADLGKSPQIREILMAVRYSATPFILSQLIYALIKKLRWYIFILAVILAVIDLSSIFNGVVFSVSEENVFHRGPLGLLPFIVVGLYCTFFAESSTFWK